MPTRRLGFFSQDTRQLRPFDAKQHELLLNGNLLMKDHLTPDHLYVDKLVSGSKGRGGGTAYMRSAMERAPNGNVKLQTAWSSMLFWLYMGMIPIDKKILQIDKYGVVGKSLLRTLAKNNDVEALTPHNKKFLKYILSKEKQLDKNKITDEDLITHRNFLLSLQEKSLDFIKDRFIPQLLTCLKDSNDKYPDTSSFDSTDMEMSHAGKERWLNAIRQNNNFIPFTNFEHLTPLMTEEQQNELQQILRTRDANLPVEMEEFGTRLHSGPTRMGR
jgi:hypothetical protein